MTSANKGRAWREQRLADALTQLAALHRQLEELQTDGSPPEAAAKRIQAVFRGLHQRRLDQKRTQLSHSRSRSLTGVGMGSTARATEQLFRARCRELFLQYDTDNSGQLSAGELADAVSDWLPDYTAEDMRRLFRSGDKDGSGFLSQREVRCGCARALGSTGSRRPSQRRRRRTQRSLKRPSKPASVRHPNKASKAEH